MARAHDNDKAGTRYPGHKQVSAVVTVEKWRQLRDIATKTERTQTDLLTEAIDDLAAKYAEQPKEPKAKKATARRERSP